MRSQWRQIASLPAEIKQVQWQIDGLRSLITQRPAQSATYRDFIGGEEPLSSVPAPIPFRSSLCRQIHFSLDQYRFWVKSMKDRPRFHRKQWEWVYIAQALFERDVLKPGKRGIAFGVGQEPLPALFASYGCDIVATDQSAEAAVNAGWAQTGQHSVDISPLNDRGICTDKMFQSLVSFAEVDMNDIPATSTNSFDFCWSSCSFEHLGSLQKGLDFVINSMGVLRPGGVAVHTTEFNLSSNEDTMETPQLSIYRRKDIEHLISELEKSGHTVEPIEWNLGDGLLGDGLAETVVDLPPFDSGGPQLRLQLGNYACTSVGLIVRRN